MIKYIVLLQNAYTDGNTSSIGYSSDMKEFDTIQEAIKHGFTLDRSDDFNVARLLKGRSKSEICTVFWMEKAMAFDKEEIKEIEKHLGIV